MAAQSKPLRILRFPQVKDRTGLSHSSTYQKISEGDFPEPISLGARAVGWIESEVEAWLVAQVEKSRKGLTVATRTPTVADVQEAIRTEISGDLNSDATALVSACEFPAPPTGLQSPPRQMRGSSKRRGPRNA